jgi:hypothetical protein
MVTDVLFAQVRGAGRLRAYLTRSTEVQDEPPVTPRRSTMTSYRPHPKGACSDFT